MVLPHTLQEARQQGFAVAQEVFETADERRRKGKLLLRRNKDEYLVVPFRAELEFGRLRKLRKNERF